MELLISGKFFSFELDILLSIMLIVAITGIFLFTILGLLTMDWVFKGFAGHSSYECGFLPYSNTRIKLDVNFAPVAVFFIIFDIEAILLLPMAVDWDYITCKGGVSILFFLLFFGLSLIYEVQSKILKI